MRTHRQSSRLFDSFSPKSMREKNSWLLVVNGDSVAGKCCHRVNSICETVGIEWVHKLISYISQSVDYQFSRKCNRLQKFSFVNLSRPKVDRLYACFQHLTAKFRSAQFCASSKLDSSEREYKINIRLE